MMNYLSSELESTSLAHFNAAAKALESSTDASAEAGGDGNGRNAADDVAAAAAATKRRDHRVEEDKIYDEITKLTKSTVDRYLHGLIDASPRL